MKNRLLIRNVSLGLIYIGFIILFSCKNRDKAVEIPGQKLVYIDTPSSQEYHEAYWLGDGLSDNEIHSIIADSNGNIWAAAASGVFKKNVGDSKFVLLEGLDGGPAYALAVCKNGKVLLGTWNGLYEFQNDHLVKKPEVEAPVSVICTNGKESYALGPNGIWYSEGNKWEIQEYAIARSVRDAVIDDNGNLWVATDAGLYRCKNGKTKLFQDTGELISSYARALAFDASGKMWTGVMGGVSVRENDQLLRNITPKEGLPSVFVNCIAQSPNGVMWVGTDIGAVRFFSDGSHSLRFSKRWLTDDKVTDIAFDRYGNAWLATANGINAIKQKKMSLADKQDYFYKELMAKHIREPWICCNLRLKIPGDTASWQQTDDDNDGEYTSGYLAMESFRYAVTNDDDARQKAHKAFSFLKKLQDITETDGFFARTIVPADWTVVHDPNQTYTPQQIADCMVEDPRFKPVEERWHLSSDHQWKWKGDTSSDEMNGHMMGYFYYYEYAADEADKQVIREHVKKIIDCLISNNYNLIDVDGKHTRWGVWSPDKLNRDPDWASEKSINSFELLAYLKFAAHITDDEKYEKEYHRLIEHEGYLENAKGINTKNPAWQVYFDRTMEGYLFPIVLRYETNPEYKAIYEQMLEKWMLRQETGENLLNNLVYTLCTGKKVNVEQTIDFLRDTPLDLVDWHIDHSKREDVQLVRSPILEEIQVADLPPASERATVRWDKNPWDAIAGNPSQVREPVFWLWPYWMARYLGIINGQDRNRQ